MQNTPQGDIPASELSDKALLGLEMAEASGEHVLAAAGNSSENLACEVEAATFTAATAVHRGNAPVPFIFGVKPADHPDQMKAFTSLVGMSAVIRLFAAMNIVQMRAARQADGPYLLGKPEEVAPAFSEASDAIVKALTGNLAAYYDITSAQTQSENELLKRSQIHEFVLARIFKAIPNLGKDQIHRLDDLLTSYTQLLKPYKIASVPGGTFLKFCILLQYVKTTDISGGGDVLIVEPFTRMVNVKLKAEEWSRALTKPGFLKRNETISFSMETTTTDLKLNDSKYEGMKAKFTVVLGKVCDGIPELKETLDKVGLEGLGQQTIVVIDDLPDQKTDDKADKGHDADHGSQAGQVVGDTTPK